MIPPLTDNITDGPVWWGDEINFDLCSLRGHGTSGCPLGSWNVRLVLRRKVCIGEIGLEPSVSDGNLTSRKDETFQRNREGLRPSTEFWRIYILQE